VRSRRASCDIPVFTKKNRTDIAERAVFPPNLFGSHPPG
jgi:hypothetical protein